MFAGTPSMLYVSLDRIWTTTPLCPGSPQFPDHCPLGGKQFLDILWGMYAAAAAAPQLQRTSLEMPAR